MMRTGQGSFEIAEQDVEPLERRDLSAGFPFWREDDLVFIAQSFQHVETEQAIGEHTAARSNCALRPWRRGGKRKAVHRVETHALRPAINHLNGGHKRDFVLRPASGFAASALASQIGIVDAHVALQRLIFLALAHGLIQFMFHQPSRLPGDPKLAHHGQRGDVGLGLGHEVDRKVSGGQRQRGVLHHRAGAQTDLVAADLALPVAQLPTPELVC